MVKKSRRWKSKTRGARYTRKRQRFGGGVETAKTYFYRNIKKRYPNVVDDEFLRSRPGVVFPSLNDVQMYHDKQIETEFKLMLDEIINMTDNKNLIDFVMQLYLTGNMGQPNSMENIGILIDNATKFNVLKQNRKNNGKELSLKDFPSLSALGDFIHDKQDAFKKIEEKKMKRSTTLAVQKKLREEGEDDVEVVLETPNYMVYRPTTEAGSKFYGRNTQWCTSAEKDNQFCDYSQRGNLYIIQSKSNLLDKSQFHPNTMEFMNPQNEMVSEQEIERLFQGAHLKRWFKDTILSALSLDSSDPLFFAKYRQKIKHKKGVNIDLFNAVFNLGEMPEVMEDIKRILLKNDVHFTGTARLLSYYDLGDMFKDEDFKKKFMKLKDKHTNTPWFFLSEFREHYPEYFDDEEIMFATLTTPYRDAKDYEIISNRLKRDLNFSKRLVSAKYEEDDDETKYCWRARQWLLEDEQVELDAVCEQIEMKHDKSNPSAPG
jgi:hypothetical protein